MGSGFQNFVADMAKPVEAITARYKHTKAEAGQEMFLTVNLSGHLLLGTFEYTPDKLADNEIDMNGFAGTKVWWNVYGTYLQ